MKAQPPITASQASPIPRFRRDADPHWHWLENRDDQAVTAFLDAANTECDRWFAPLEPLVEALYRAEVRGLTLTRVQGHGGEMEQVETYRGTTVKVDMQDKVRLEIGVSEAFAGTQPAAPAVAGPARRTRGR